MRRSACADCGRSFDVQVRVRVALEGQFSTNLILCLGDLANRRLHGFAVEVLERPVVSA